MKQSNNLTIPFFVTFLVIVLYTNRNHLNVNQYTNIPLELYVASEITTNSYHEYLPKSADINIFTKATPLISPEDVQIIEWTQNTKSLDILLNNPNQQEITLRHFSFPGTTLQVNGNDMPYSLDSYGLTRTTLGQGEQRVEILFQETVLIKLAKVITLLSVLAIIIFVKYVKI